MTNTRGQLIGWCLRRSTAPRWLSSAGLDWACSPTPSSVRTPSLILTSQVSHRAQVPPPRKTPEQTDLILSVIIKCCPCLEWNQCEVHVLYSLYVRRTSFETEILSAGYNITSDSADLCFVDETIDSCSRRDSFADWLNYFMWPFLGRHKQWNMSYR